MMQLVDKVWTICEPAVRELGLELVEVEHVRAPGGAVLRLYIDREGGVSVTDCAGVSREVGHLLDAEDVMQGRYFLEVSSPGVDRVLRKPEHFEKFRGREVRVRTKAPVGGKRKLTGRIASCSNDTLCIQCETGEVVEVPLGSIEKANLRGELDFGRGKGGEPKKKKSGKHKR
jgi:ribosome maturation factor RimP